MKVVLIVSLTTGGQNKEAWKRWERLKMQGILSFGQPPRLLRSAFHEIHQSTPPPTPAPTLEMRHQQLRCLPSSNGAVNAAAAAGNAGRSSKSKKGRKNLRDPPTCLLRSHLHWKLAKWSVSSKVGATLKVVQIQQSWFLWVPGS